MPIITIKRAGDALRVSISGYPDEMYLPQQVIADEIRHNSRFARPTLMALQYGNTAPFNLNGKVYLARWTPGARKVLTDALAIASFR